MTLDPRTDFTPNQRRVARLAFLWRRAGVHGAVIASRGTPEEIRAWLAVRTRRSLMASTFVCPAFVADSLTYAIGFTDDRVAVIQFETARLPPGRCLRFYAWDDLRVTDLEHGPFTAVYVGEELFQVGHTDAGELRRILRKR